MRRSSLLILLIVTSLSVTGCEIIKTAIKLAEPAFSIDPTPPPGYSPIYVQQVSPFSTNVSDPALEVTRVEAMNPTRVRVYMHLLDSSGTYLTGAPTDDYSSWLCEVTDIVDGNSMPVTDFEIREVTEADRNAQAVALVMDHSGSMGQNRAIVVQQAAADLIDRKLADDQMALVKYDGEVKVEAPLTSSKSQLRASLRRDGLAGFGGMTAIANGLEAGIREVAKTDGGERRSVIIFTDGLDNQSTITRDSVINLARQHNVIVNAVDFGTRTDAGYLQAVAERTGGSYYKIYQTAEFEKVFDDIYRRMHNYYVLEYSPYRYGSHTVELKLCLPNDTMTTAANFDNTPDVGTVSLLNVHFDHGKAELKPASNEALDNVLGLMTAVPTIKIELRGHTDSTNSTGDPDFNQKLSQRRAEAVRQALIDRGVTADRITAVGFGESQPVATNATATGRALNRRTEFKIIER